MIKFALEMLALMIIILNGAFEISAAYFISTGTHFTIDKSSLGLIGVITILAGCWLFLTKKEV